MSVDINLLKQLRNATFAPMKDCKDALVEANGDLEKAEEILKKKGIMKVGNKADRATNEGIVKVAQKDGRLAGLKLLCETDFVAKNEDFIKLSNNLLDRLLASKKVTKSLEEVDAKFLAELNEMVAAFVGKIGENMKLTEVLVENENAYVYNHPGNKVASVIYYEGGNEYIAKELALQVTAMSPTYLDFDSVPADYRDSLMVEFRKEMEGSNKPQNIIDQILEGKLRKALAELVLMEQEYIRDAAKKTKEIVPADMVVKGYTRISVR
ncbi:MAG: translation elongation factor Ts [candidate division SR1 bacterium CG_4_9_14_3_um_filter_40_9]|nr:MAG: translation elongation factor Ts [candidate division SR1 bacterium CG_4_9_14_3_um_filter_40_9]